MYRYELHCHENLINWCARWTPEEMVKAYSDLGYTGIVVTDHFFNNPSCKISSELSWREKIEQFYAGYERTKEEGDKYGLDVFFAFEYSANSYYMEDLSSLGEKNSKDLIEKNDLRGCDFLIYGLGKEWLLNKDESILKLSVNDFMKMVKEEGGTVIQAHPFRLERSYMDHISLFPNYTDGVEIINGSPNTIGRSNRLAKAYAEEYGFFFTAGTDAHSITEHLAVTQLEERVSSVDELIAALKSGKAKLSLEKNPLYRT